MRVHLETPWTTYADDSYVRVPGQTAPRLLVTGQVPELGDFRWLESIRDRLGRRPQQPVKYADARRVYDDTDAALRRAILSGIGPATIIVLDLRDRSHLPTWMRSLSPEFLRTRHARVVRRFIDSWDDELAFAASPAFSIDFHVRGPDSDPYRLLKRLGNSHNVRLSSVRLTAAFIEYADGTVWDFVRRRAQELRFFLPERYIREFLLDEVGRDRFFDRGNDHVTGIIRGVREHVHEWLAPYIEEEEAPLGRTEDLVTKDRQDLQAADIAAGFARVWYEQHGVGPLLDSFRAVVLNGKVVSKE